MNWNKALHYYCMPDQELRRRCEGSGDSKIDNIRKMRGSLSHKQRWCLAIHVMKQEQGEATR